jgi:hypothetical protein
MSKAQDEKLETTAERSKEIRTSGAADTSANLALAITSPELAAMELVGNVKIKRQVTEQDLPALLSTLGDLSRAIRSGDLSRVEAMLINQATALQSLFTRLTLRGLEQPHMANLEGFLRLALRAQNQCRTTLETLASVKCPPPIIANQANVAIGCPQQVNNHLHPAPPEIPQNQLLEKDNESRMDAGAQTTSGQLNSALEAVGEINWPQNT